MEFDARKEIKLIIEKWLKDTLKKSDIKENDNLIEKGLSSMQVMQLSGILKKEGLRISFAKLIEKPTLNSWFDLVANSKIIKKHSKDNKKSNDGKDSFNLTDVQYSYFIGRSDDQTLGGVGCHAYIEIDGKDIDYKRLNDAWNILQYRHPMLRARFTEDGKQEILDKPFSEEIEVFDLSNLDDEETKIRLDEIRENLSHRKLRVKMGEVAGLKLANLSQNINKIFFDLDLLVADVMSMSILLKELGESYSGKELDNLNNYTFKDYINNLEVDSEIYKKDQEFWKEKIDSFEIERPNLPLRKDPEKIKETRFTRRKRVIEKDKWSKIKEIAASYKSTPSMVLLTAYASILERWTNQDKFFINLPLFNRDLSNENLKDMVADFTNILLVEHERKHDTTFIETLNRISKTFIENASHSSYSGVQVQRDISKSQGTSLNVAPVVFACNIDYPIETEISRKALGKITYMVSQTPGVWLDFQSYIKDGDLVLCWDTVDELFPEGLLDDMFDSLYELLLSLTRTSSWGKKVDVLPKNQKSIREYEVERILPLKYPNETLYDGFIRNANLHPEKIALIDSNTKEEISYQKLYEYSLKIADYLKKNAVQKGDYIGITLPRGSRQIFAIFGILFAGAAYVPIGINQPNDRRSKIYDQIGIKHIITDRDTVENCNLNKEEVQILDLDLAMTNESKLEKPVEISPFDSSYIIMTSGTTGVPKGVEIMHTSAINTCIDLNEKYKIGPEDTILMVSAIDFDLSVYDIFGVFHAGGTLITTSEDNYRNPDEWLKLIDDHKVTIWDSVPILFDMVTTMAEGKNRKLPFRIVMLSGDWIAINLPERFYNISECENSIVVAMGGATEASIWSNYLNVPRKIPEDWISIPYGKPLKNQVYRVVDELGRICPNYVKGELLIGGVGVAKCYHGDDELTGKKYFEEDGIRWYRTGDNGRTWNDSTIEFLGRKDTQVKIKGHRIELGEIEDALLSNPKIKNAISEIVDIGSNNQIVAFVEYSKSKDKSDISYGDEINELISDSYKNYKDVSLDLEIKNKEVINIILNIFMSLGIEENKIYTNEDVIKTGKADRRYSKLIERWIDILTSRQITTLDNNGNIAFGFNREIDTLSDSNKNLVDKIVSILKGDKNPIEVFYDVKDKISPTDLLGELDNYEESINLVSKLIRFVTKKKNQKIKILELGARDSNLAETIFKNSKKFIERYVAADTSMYFKDIYEETDSCNKAFEFVQITSGESISLSLIGSKFDLVIFWNSLHRSISIEEIFEDLMPLLSDNALLVGQEINNKLLIPEVSAAILEKGFEDYKLVNSTDTIIPGKDTISKAIDTDVFETIFISDNELVERTGFFTFILRDRELNIDTDEIVRLLKSRLPEYMIPLKFIEVSRFPLNKNGKVDRKALIKTINKDKVGLSRSIADTSSKDVVNDTIEKLIEIYQEVLEKEDITHKSNYFSVGGDSLIATRIVAKVQEILGVEISIADIFNMPIIGELALHIKEQELIIQEEANTIVPDKDNLYKPFPLTDVQFAYWLGRSGAYSLSKVSTQCYYEFECTNIDVTKLQNVINQMIQDHDMLRNIILSSGEQQILEQVPPFLLSINDLRGFTESQKDEAIISLRNTMSRRILPTDTWPIFDFKLSILDDARSILHVSLDNILLDGWSMFHILLELKKRYEDTNYRFKNQGISFRDYVLALEKSKNNSRYLASKEYWLNRLDGFLESPKFPNIKSEDKIEKQIFNRREAILEVDEWEKLKVLARENSLTPVNLIIAMFSEILRKYSISDEFSLNITQFMREQVHPNINNIVGDFTSLTFLEIRHNEDDDIISKAKRIQKQMLEDMDNRYYSAVEFGRELRGNKNEDKKSLMPIVFTSGLGIAKFKGEELIGSLIYNISQTPQVWLDHQVLEVDGRLKLTWDSVDEIFGEEFLTTMFDNYIDRIRYLIRTKDYSLEKKSQDHRKSNGSIMSSNEYEEIAFELSKIWNDILKIKNIKVDDNFFELGGNSLTMVQLANKLKEKYGFNLDFTAFLEKADIRRLALSILGKKI